MELPDKFAALGLTYDDVLLLPGEPTSPRATSTPPSRLTREISLKVPLICAAMDTVTESRMAIAMARQGGIGVLHRNLSIEDQAYQVDLVKRTQTGIISNPVTIGPDATLEELDPICGEYRVSGLPVVDTDNRLLGIITNRDLRFTPVAEWATTKVDEVMTPMPLITGPVGISRDDATLLLRKHKRERLPLVDDQGRLGRPDHGQGLRQVRAVPRTPRKDADGRLMVGAAIGYFGDAWQRATTLVEAGVDVLVADTAHGHVRMLLEMVQPPQDRPGHQARAGDRRQRRHPGGRPGVRRRRRGRGQGGRRARLDLYDPRGHRGRRTPGHRGLRGLAGLQAGRRPGDRGRRPASTPARSPRRIVAGADTVMVGSLLAGCEESPGELVFVNGKQFKAYRGMGSLGAMSSRGKKSYSKDRYFQAEVTSDDKIVPEGIEGQVAYRGPLVRGRAPADRRPQPVDVLLRRPHHRRAAGEGPVRADHLGLAQGEPPARRADDRRGARTTRALELSRAPRPAASHR